GAVVSDVSEIPEGFNALSRELQARKRDATRRKPVTVVLSDCIDMLKGADQQSKRQFLQLVNEGRKFGMFAVLDAQSDNVSSLGLPGAAKELAGVNGIDLKSGQDSGHGIRTATVRAGGHDKGTTYATPPLPSVADMAEPAVEARRQKQPAGEIP